MSDRYDDRGFQIRVPKACIAALRSIGKSLGVNPVLVETSPDWWAELAQRIEDSLVIKRDSLVCGKCGSAMSVESEKRWDGQFNHHLSCADCSPRVGHRAVENTVDIPNDLYEDIRQLCAGGIQIGVPEVCLTALRERVHQAKEGAMERSLGLLRETADSMTVWSGHRMRDVIGRFLKDLEREVERHDGRHGDGEADSASGCAEGREGGSAEPLDPGQGSAAGVDEQAERWIGGPDLPAAAEDDAEEGEDAHVLTHPYLLIRLTDTVSPTHTRTTFCSRAALQERLRGVRRGSFRWTWMDGEQERVRVPANPSAVMMVLCLKSGELLNPFVLEHLGLWTRPEGAL